MFERRIEEISKKLGGERKEFYILTHRKHGREIYFQNKKKAVMFMKTKLNSPIKKLIYLLLQLNILQFFLKKIKLSSKLGDVLFIANQIKTFDLKNKEVISFIKDDSIKKLFIKSKEFQNKISKEGFAPIIFKINKKFPYSKEELLRGYSGGDDLGIFKKLLSYYKINKITEITLKEYVDFLKKELTEKNVKKDFIKNLLNKIILIYPKNTKLKMVKIHGSFTKEQVLLKNGCYIFTDWEENEKGLIIQDLLNYFRTERNFLNNKHFNEILKIYPKDVRKNIKLYLVLGGVYFMTKSNRSLEISNKLISHLKPN